MSENWHAWVGSAAVGVTAVSGVSKRTKNIGQLMIDMSRLVNILTSSTPESESLSSSEERIA